MSAVDTLRERFDSLNERERRIVTIGAILAVVLLVLGAVLPLGRAVDRAERRVAGKQGDLAWMQQVGPALGAVATSTPPSNQESLIVLVDRTARESGLGQALTGSQPSGAGSLRTTFEKAEFSSLVAWIASLATQHGVQTETASFDAAEAPGTVNAVIVLRLR